MIFIGLLFVLLGILVKYAKMYFLVAGYNTMSKEQKSQVDIKGVATVFRNAMFGMALIIFMGIIAAAWFENPMLESNSIYLAVFIGVPYLLIKANSSKYKINNKDRS